MARKQKLKVYRTPIGFHDAYVAAASQKAALKAWGSDNDLFARGVAEAVTDPTLMAEPISNPGVVVKRSRGTAAEQIAALPKNVEPATRRGVSGKEVPPGKRTPHREAKRPTKPSPPSAPPPDRSTLDEAEQALTEAQSRQRAEDRALRKREALIARERRELDETHAAEIHRLCQARDREERAYRRALQKWRG